MEFWQVIISALGTLGGLTALVSLIVFFRQVKRKQINDADEGEIKNLSDIIDQLKSEVERQNARITMLEELNGIKDREILSLEKDNIIFKRAYNCQPECEIEESKCPICKKYKLLTK